MKVERAITIERETSRIENLFFCSLKPDILKLINQNPEISFDTVNFHINIYFTFAPLAKNTIKASKKKSNAMEEKI